MEKIHVKVTETRVYETDVWADTVDQAAEEFEHEYFEHCNEYDAMLDVKDTNFEYEME